MNGVDYCGTDLSSRDALELHSSSDHSDVCLSYVFTNRNFRDGALGLAWTAAAAAAATTAEENEGN